MGSCYLGDHIAGDHIPMDMTCDGWITCNFMSFSTVFQSYKDDGREIMKDLKDFHSELIFFSSLQLMLCRVAAVKKSPCIPS